MDEFVPHMLMGDQEPTWIKDEVEASDESTSSTSVEELCERFQVDMDHARYVTDAALLLFDRTESVHRLGADRRRLLAAMAMLHNVGLEVDPDRHHVAGRDIVLANWLEPLTEMEQQMLAAAVYLHRKRIRRRKLEAGIVASLPLGLRQDTLVLAALVRIADGLDYSQSQSTRVERVNVLSAAVQVELAGPSAQVDAARAQVKADLWEVVFGEMPFFFAAPGQEMRGDVQTEPETGAELLVGVQTALGQAAPQKAPGILPDDPMSEAGRKVLLFHLARMLKHEEGTREGIDIEELHDMRVATRRMRSAFRTFAAYYEPRAIRPYVVGLRRTARALGKVRDLDVFMQKARSYLDGLGQDHARDLDLLLDAWQGQREEARVAMIQVLDGSKYRDFVDAFRLFLESPGAGARRGDRIPPRPTLVCHVAPQLIYGRWASVQAFGPLLEGAPVSVLHALRIECKRLRYTLEFFAEVLAPAAKQVIEAVIELQDHLGDLNDADVANVMLSDFLFSPSGGEGGRLIAPGVVAYLAVKQRELQALVEAFPQAWEVFNQPSTRQALAEAVGVL
jgi:CHAD domain-containing protein